MNRPMNGKNVAPNRTGPVEVAGENIAYIESDAPVVPCMMPVDWPGSEQPGTINRYRWSAQAISATREIRYFYRREPHLVQVEMTMHVGFPYTLPTARYAGVWLMDARTTRPICQAVFSQERRYVGRDDLNVHFSANLEFPSNEYLRFVADLTTARRMCISGMGRGDFSDVSLSQYGLNHVAATLDQAHKDLAHQRSMGNVASHA